VQPALPLNPQRVYDILYGAYGPQHWWPGDTPLEITVGAVLTQNTSWHNVAIAIGNLKDADLLSLDALLAAKEAQVKAAIRPAGFHNLKYRRLLALLRMLDAQGGLEALEDRPTGELRALLLTVNGIGPETADSILLYALGRPLFVVDRYTRRIMTRLGYAWTAFADYDGLQRWFMDALGDDARVLNEYHALIVAHGKTRCRVTPRCEGCPFTDACTHLPRTLSPNAVTATSAGARRIDEVPSKA
jgi:endonuclease-3 related protein